MRNELAVLFAGENDASSSLLSTATKAYNRSGHKRKEFFECLFPSQDGRPVYVSTRDEAGVTFWEKQVKLWTKALYYVENKESWIGEAEIEVTLHRDQERRNVIEMIVLILLQHGGKEVIVMKGVFQYVYASLREGSNQYIAFVIDIYDKLTYIVAASLEQ